MKGIATILRETNIPKIEGRLVTFDTEGEVDGKCALGVISCEVGLPLGSNYEAHPTWEQILRKAGCDHELLDGTIPSVSPSFTECPEFLTHYIITLNDHFKLTFKEIADWFETTFPEDDWAQ